MSVSSSPKRRELPNYDKLKKKFDSGYDSEGKIGPFYDCWEDEGDQMFDEDEVPQEMDFEEDVEAVATVAEEGGDDQNVATAQVVEATQVREYIHIENEAVMKFGVKELKEELKKRNLKVGGQKEELGTCLLKAL